jgi:hypothetical protein
MKKPGSITLDSPAKAPLSRAAKASRPAELAGDLLCRKDSIPSSPSSENRTGKTTLIENSFPAKRAAIA